MRREYTLGERSRFEQRETKKHRISENSPDGRDDVIRIGNVLNQHGINADTDHDEKSLEAERKQGPEIILPDHALFPIPKGRKRNRCKTRHE